MDNHVICLQSPAFYSLLDEVVDHINIKFKLAKESQWLDAETAMKLLGIKSKTTLQELRDTGQIRFSQPMHKIILYDRFSIEAFLDKHAKETF